MRLSTIKSIMDTLTLDIDYRLSEGKLILQMAYDEAINVMIKDTPLHVFLMNMDCGMKPDVNGTEIVDYSDNLLIEKAWFVMCYENGVHPGMLSEFFTTKWYDGAGYTYKVRGYDPYNDIVLVYCLYDRKNYQWKPSEFIENITTKRITFKEQSSSDTVAKLPWLYNEDYALVKVQ